MATSSNQDRSTLEKRLARVRSEMEAIKKRGQPNWEWSRQWFDLRNEEAQIEATLGQSGDSAGHQG